MGNVLYELGFDLNIMIIISIVVSVAFPLHVIFRLKRSLGKYGMIFCVIWYVVFIAVLGFSAFSYFNTYNILSDAYTGGEYQVVEGYVEEFDPLPFGGKGKESFEIGGVEFSYSDYSISPGYNNTKALGGVIKGDGQHLKIGYVFIEGYGNVIVYIEELSSE